MLSFIPGPLLGVISALLILINTLMWTPLLFLFSFIKLILPFEAWRSFWSGPVIFVTENWAVGNVVLATKVLDIEWDIQINADLDYKGWYLVLPNHQSWVDIVAMQVALNKKVPFFRFFLKQELVWVPILGVAWIALDYPFMKRYTKAEIEKDPSLKGKDIEEAKKACEKYKDRPVAITNFLEGTRNTKEKHDKQSSPYPHLLKPKSGGIAFALSVMDGQITKLLDVHIVYPHGSPGMWDLLSGNLKKVVVHVDEKIIPENMLAGDYENDNSFKSDFQNWVTELWQTKNKRIEELKDNG